MVVVYWIFGSLSVLFGTMLGIVWTMISGPQPGLKLRQFNKANYILANSGFFICIGIILITYK